MKTQEFQVVVRRVESEDGVEVLLVRVEVPTAYPVDNRTPESSPTEQPIPLQAQVRAALELARPSVPGY